MTSVFKDDVSAIPTTGCSYFSGDYLYNRSNTIESRFKLIGNRWVEVYKRERSSYDPVEYYTCIDINELNSYAALEPLYYNQAIFAVLIIFMIVANMFRSLR